MPCQGALSQAALAAACRNTNWEVRQRSGFNELPCCNSNSLVLFTDTLLMRCLSEGKLGWVGGRRQPRGKRRTLTSPEAFTAAGPRPIAEAVRSICETRVKGVEPSCPPQAGHRSPRQWQRAPSPCPLMWTVPLKGNTSTLLSAHTPWSLYPSSHSQAFLHQLLVQL